MHRFSVLVIDDDRSIRKVIGELLRSKGIRVLSAENAQSGLHFVMYDSVDLVLLDLCLPGKSGLEVLRECQRIRPSLPILMITGQGTIESAVQAMRLGACDYITKPLTSEKLLESLSHAHKNFPKACARDATTVCSTVETEQPTLVARSPSMCEILAVVERISSTRASVLIQGEAGVGKETIARQIHQLSNQREGPFVRVNCGAIQKRLVESELFGDETGAPTSAGQRRVGCFERAKGGTLFLGEVGELPLRAQALLLHALQDGQCRRVGGPEVVQVDMRVIAATNRDMEADVQQGRFHRELYYFLNVVAISIPPLRERPEDLTVLIEHFVQVFSAVHGKARMEISKEVMDRLLAYDWPGNVSELSSVVERAVVLSGSEAIGPQFLPEPPKATQPPNNPETVAVPLLGSIDDMERHLIREMIVRCHGNKAEAARRLGMHRRTLYRLLERATDSLPVALGPSPTPR